METIMILLAAVMPTIVMKATNSIKELRQIKLSGSRVMWIRAVVAVLSLVGAILTYLVGGAEVDGSLIEAAIVAVVTAGVTTYQYSKTK